MPAADTEGVTPTTEQGSALASAGIAESYREPAIAAGALTAGPFLREALRHLARLSAAEGSPILLVDRDRVRHGAASGLPDSYIAAIDGLTISATTGTCGVAAATGHPRVTPDIREDPNWTGFKELAEAVNLRSCWSVPITTPDGRVLGAFATYASTPGCRRRTTFVPCSSTRRSSRSASRASATRPSLPGALNPSSSRPSAGESRSRPHWPSSCDGSGCGNGHRSVAFTP